MTTLGLIAAALLIGCGTTPPQPSSGASPPQGDRSHGSPSVNATAPVRTGELLLRWRLTGGLAGVGGPGTPPDFSLYGDGRAIVADTGMGVGIRSGTGTGPVTRLREYRLTPAALQRLLQDARAAGLDHSRTLDQPGVADAFTLEIIFGSAQTRIVMAGSGETDPAVRFSRERLDPAKWAPADQSTPARPYEAARLAVLAGDDLSRQGPTPRRWPLHPIGDGVAAAGGRCLIVSGSDLSAANRLFRTAQPGTRWVSGGKVYTVRFRPLLPDETTCAAVVRA